MSTENRSKREIIEHLRLSQAQLGLAQQRIDKLERSLLHAIDAHGDSEWSGEKEARKLVGHLRATPSREAKP